MDDYLPATSITTPLTERKLEDMTVPPVMQAPARDFGVDTSTSTNQRQDPSVWRAGWELDTIPGAMLNRRDAGITHDDDGTDPFAENKGTKFEQMPEYFTDIFNRPALAARRAQIEREQELRAVQERSPWGAAGASLALQVADPTILIPGAGLVKVGRGAYRFAGSFAKVGASAAGATAVQEAVLQSQQQLRTGEESALAVGSAFVLGGMLGGGLSLLTRPEIRTATTGLDSILNTRPGPDGTVAAGSATALTDMATKLRAGERVTTDEIQEWAKSARIEARNGRDATPETIARWEEIDRQSALLERAASVARASEIEIAARTAFGGDGNRLVRGGGLQVVQSVEDLPARSDGLAHPTDVRGVFDGNKAYIVADNVTPDEVPSVLLHEVGVHYGMERMVGAENFRVLLDDVMARATANEARFAEALAAVPADTPAIHRGEEVLAYLVENAPELGIVQRVIAAVKQFIRQVSGGKYAGLSEADIRQLAVAALRKWNPEARPAEIDGPRYSRKARGSSIDYRVGDESLEKYGLTRGGRYNTREIAAAMEARQRDLIGTIARDDFSEGSAKKIGKWMTEEVKWAVDQQKNGVDTGVGWYSEKYQRALDQFADVFPELKTEKTKRDFFTALVAIMSDGQKVYNNFIYAARMYDTYRTSGRLPEDVTFGGERSTSMRTNLAAINHLIAKYGEEGMAKYLMQEFTVSQLAKMAKESGVTFSTSYKADTTLPLAALVFGPKLGAFYSNLMGSHGYLTMDRWWTRTFNRYRGQLLSRVSGTEDAPVNTKGEAVGLARFKGMLGEPNLSDEEALSRLKGYADSYAAKGFKNGTDIEKAANTLYKDAFVNLEDQPFNASDRAFMIKAANEAQRTLKKQGVDLSIADIQAVLWYYEKRLYGDLGARQSADVSYEEAAARVVRNSKDAGPGRWSAQDDGADAVRGPDGIDRPLDTGADDARYSRGGNRNERVAAQAERLAKALASIDDPAAFSAAIASRGGAVGAEVVDKATMEDLSIYGKPANAVASVTAFMNPILRTRTSPVAAVRRIGQKLFSDTIYSNMHMQGRTMGPAAEDLIKSQAQAMMGEAIQKYDALYQEGRKAGMRLTKTQFSEAISAAMRRKDKHEVPAVAKAAKMWRDVVFDPLKRMAQETRIKGGYLLDPDIEAKFADSYLHRMANHKRLTADEFGFKNAVAGYMEGMMRGQYAKEADEIRARLAAFEQDKVDLSLDPDARLAELEGLDKAYEDLDLRFAREANMRREISNLTSKAVLARQKGDKGTMKAAYDEIRKVKASGGKEFDDYMRQFYTLNRRRKNVDLGFAGMAERQDDLRQKLEDVNDANLRAMDRLVAKGQKLERDLAKLDPVTRSERIAELRDQMTAVLERQDKAAERLFNQVERAEKAKARAALQVLKEKRAGGMKEALAGNTEAKASAEDAAREKALDESIRKYVAAEQKRSEQLAAIGRRMDRLDALDLDGQAAELRAAVNEIVKQQSDLSIGRGKRSQRIKDRLAKVDPAQVQKRIDEVDSRIKAIEREFYDKWEIKNAGEGVDLHAMVAKPTFTDWAKNVANDAFDFYSGRAPEAGTVPDFLAPIKSGPLKERTLPVPDEVLEPWLENDIGSIAQKYVRSMLGQIEVARKFGSTTMEDEIAEVTDAYRAARESVNAAGDVKAAVEAIGQNPSIKDAFEAWRRGEPEAKVTKERIATWLEKREQSDKDDILAGRDLLLGRYAMEENQSDLGKISRVAIAYNFARYMGGYIIGSLTDIYRPAMVHGLGHYLNHGIKPLLTNLEGVKLAAKEAQKAGVGVERWTHAYVTSAAGIGDPYAQGTGLERLMDKVSKTAATWNGMTLFNDFTRSIGGIDAMDKILIASTKKTDTPYLAMLGIDPGMAQRIADQFKLHGRDIRGTLVAETDNWTDKEAVRMFRAAVSKDVNSMFVERSVGDVPLFVNRPLGRMITQFRTFNMASNQRVLMRGLQEDQGRFIGSLVAMTTIGMMVAALRSWRGGEDRWEKFKKSAENPGFLIGEGLDNSGIFALFFEGANTIEKLSQPSGVSFNPIKKPLMMVFPGATQQGESTRFVRRSPLESVLGPSAGIPQQVAQAFGGDAKAITSLTPGASHSPFREFIQAISGNSAYGF